MSMIELHTLIEGEIEVVTPLHVGSGEFKEDGVLPRNPQDAPDTSAPASARVQIDGRDRAYIPGSSLKGALRARMEQFAEAAVPIVFGTIKGVSSGRAGALVVLGADIKTAPKSSDLPLFQKLRATTETNRKGRAMAARTAVSPARGTADHAKLFFAECIVPGVIFRFRARYTPPQDKAEARIATDALRQLLADWQAGTLAMGRGTADGEGRTRLKNVSVTRLQLDSRTGDVSASADPALVSQASAAKLPGQSLVLTLVGQGPYFVQDWAYEREQTTESDDAQDRSDANTSQPAPHMRWLRDHDGIPALPGTSLMGSLRSRALWLARTHGRPDSLVDILFGTTEAKARLLVDTIRFEGPVDEVTMTSVKLDRFSAAPFDGGLFGTACVADPRFQARLRLHPSCTSEARAFLYDVIVPDLVRNGLKLGHSSTRGFGWFTVNADVSQAQEVSR